MWRQWWREVVILGSPQSIASLNLRNDNGTVVNDTAMSNTVVDNTLNQRVLTGAKS